MVDTQCFIVFIIQQVVLTSHHIREMAASSAQVCEFSRFLFCKGQLCRSVSYWVQLRASLPRILPECAFKCAFVWHCSVQNKQL